MKSLLMKGLSVALLTAAIAPTALAANGEKTTKTTVSETQTEFIKAHSKRKKEWYDRESNRVQAENDSLKGHKKKREWYDRESRR